LRALVSAPRTRAPAPPPPRARAGSAGGGGCRSGRGAELRTSMGLGWRSSLRDDRDAGPPAGGRTPPTRPLRSGCAGPPTPSATTAHRRRPRVHGVRSSGRRDLRSRRPAAVGMGWMRRW
jgi:hypothetical protein